MQALARDLSQTYLCFAYTGWEIHMAMTGIQHVMNTAWEIHMVGEGDMGDGTGNNLMEKWIFMQPDVDGNLFQVWCRMNSTFVVQNAQMGHEIVEEREIWFFKEVVYVRNGLEPWVTVQQSRRYRKRPRTAHWV